MKPHESPRIRKKSIHGDSGDSWPVWNRGIRRGMKVAWSVNLSTVGGVSLLSPNVFCLSVFIRN